MVKFNLQHGDCLELMKDIPDESVDMILCDLPYGITANKWDIIIPFDKLWKQYNRIVKKDSAIVLFSQQPFTSKLIYSNVHNFKHEIIWKKNKATNFLRAKYQPLKVHENIEVFSKGGVHYNPQKYKVVELNEILNFNKKQLAHFFKLNQFDCVGKIDRRKNINKPVTNKKMNGLVINRNRKKDTGYRFPKDVVFFNKVARAVHPTQKPVDLLEYLIKTYTNEGMTVLDNCMGSGSTGVACVNTNRNFIGMELDDKYFEIAKERINKTQEKKLNEN